MSLKFNTFNVFLTLFDTDIFTKPKQSILLKMLTFVDENKTRFHKKQVINIFK